MRRFAGVVAWFCLALWVGGAVAETPSSGATAPSKPAAAKKSAPAKKDAPARKTATTAKKTAPAPAAKAPPVKKEEAPVPAAPATPVEEAAAPEEAPANDGALSITSRAMESDDQKQLVIFTGDVVAIDGELKVNSQKLTLHYAGSGEKQEIRKVVAEGDVTIKQAESTGTGSTAIYTPNEKVLELLGGGGKKAVVVSKSDHLEGDRVLLYLNEKNEVKKVKAEGSNNRVSVRLEKGGGSALSSPGDKEKKGASKQPPERQSEYESGDAGKKKEP